MARYRTAWFSGVVLFGAIGTWAAIDALSVGGVLTILVLAACVGVSVALVPLKPGESRPWRRALWVGAMSGAAVVAAAGLMSRFGAWGAAVAVAMTVASPSVVRWCLRWYHRFQQGMEPEGPFGSPEEAAHLVTATSDTGYEGWAGASQAAEPPFVGQPWMASEPASLDDASLCLAWRKTYVALQRVHAPTWTLRVAQRRQELLDELERRNATGFSAWLAAGARAAGDPSKYFVAESRPTDHHHRK